MRSKTIIIIVAFALLAVLAIALFLHNEAKAPEAQGTAASDYRNGTYAIDGTDVTLAAGYSAVPVAPGSASEIVTHYFGNDAAGDLNGDGVPDAAFILTQSGGGSGTFYYIAAAIKTSGGGWQGTNAVLLGDRIAPQSTSIANGEITVNYADRAPNQPMTAQPSIGVSKHFKLENGTLTEITN